MHRTSGILLHPTSLPSPHGIGDLGPAAFEWIDLLATTETGLWQMLPLGPTGYGDSPYQCFSTLAGNPYLISPDRLLTDGLLVEADFDSVPSLPDGIVDYGTVIPWKLELTRRAFDRLGASHLHDAFEAFRDAHPELLAFADFMALKEAHGGAPWWTWEQGLRDRESAELNAELTRLARVRDLHLFRQFLFFRQWQAVRDHAASRRIRIVGDLPIFVAEDSADVWLNRDAFLLDEAGRPTVVAGVPPDYFSPTGQLWGNPLYNWEHHRETGYRWWVDRLRATFDLVDIVRLDHFRGFSAYWEIPADAETAVSGRWITGPGTHFLTSMRDALGSLPIIAEDLGEITPDVIELRDRFELPGMKILQFAFDSNEENDFLPHRYPANCVVYTGTHDNDTSRGWFASASDGDGRIALDYLETDGSDFAWDLIRAAWHSRADWAVAPAQDFLDLPSSARMNTPSTASGNWSWRLQADAMNAEIQDRIRALNAETGRTRAFDR